MKQGLLIKYEIDATPGVIMRPLSLRFLEPSQTENHQRAFDYMDDVLLGVGARELISHFEGLQNKNADHAEQNFVHGIWMDFEAHFHFWEKSRHKVENLKKKLTRPFENQTLIFETQMQDLVSSIVSPHEVRINELTHLIPIIDSLETHIGEPLLYNFKLNLRPGTLTWLHYLYSTLFHLRALAAIDYNSGVKEVTYEGVKVDSVTDYLGKADYVANDALALYFFEKHGTHFKTKHKSEEFEHQFFKPMKKLFDQYCYHGSQLVRSLPEHFIASQTAEQAEESLYLAQMDWLLGSESGLLYRIREELYGLRDGYEVVFWPDVDPHGAKREGVVDVNVWLSPERLNQVGAA